MENRKQKWKTGERVGGDSQVTARQEGVAGCVWETGEKVQGYLENKQKMVMNWFGEAEEADCILHTEWEGTSIYMTPHICAEWGTLIVEEKFPTFWMKLPVHIENVPARGCFTGLH